MTLQSISLLFMWISNHSTNKESKMSIVPWLRVALMDVCIVLDVAKRLV